MFAGRPTVIFLNAESHPLDKTIHHPLLARPVELDGELVAVYCGDVAVAEFLVKDAVAEGEGGDGAGGFGHQLAFDGERHAAGVHARAPRALTRAFGATSPARGEVKWVVIRVVTRRLVL